MFGNITIAQDKSASGTVTSYSVSLSMMGGWNTGGYGFEVYFSTYDGNTNAYPMGFSNSLSYELMPSTPGQGTYYTDFVIFAPAYNAYYKRGTMTVTMPTTDADGNGCPDAFQVNKSFSNTGSVSSTEYNSDDGGYSRYLYGFRSYSFTFSRSSGNPVGSLTGSGVDPATGTTSTFSGNYNVEGGTGATTYNPTTKAIRFAGNSFSFGTSGTGTSTFTRINDNQVSVAQFNFITSDGYTRTVKAFTLNRTGNYYRAYPVELVDGDPATPYVDFRYCHVEILDSNDTDGDGIPDLSDANSMINQTITFNALTPKTYGDSSFSLTGSTSSGLPLSYASSNTSVATVSGSAVTIVGAGTAIITASQSGSSSYNAAASVSQTLTVSKATLSASAITMSAPLSLVYSGAGKSFTASASGVSGFTYTYNGVLPTTYASSSTAPSNAGTYKVTASSIDPNYSGSKEVSFSITPAPVSVVAAAKTKPFGSADPALTYTASGLIGSGNLTGALSRREGESAGNYEILIGTLSAGPNYALSYTGASLVIQANYQSWAAAHNLAGNDASNDSDPDQDGLSNAHEFAMGGNPTIASKSTLVITGASGGMKCLWVQRKDKTLVSYSPKTSADLGAPFTDWTPIQPVLSDPQPEGIHSDYEQVEVIMPTSGGKGFLKVQATVQ